jgi:hypothetical protein
MFSTPYLLSGGASIVDCNRTKNSILKPQPALFQVGIPIRRQAPDKAPQWN